MQSLIIMLLIKASSRNAIRKKCGSNSCCYCCLFERNSKTICPMSRIRQAGTPVTYIQSALRTASDLCKNVPFAVYFGSNVIHIYIYIYLFIYIYMFVINP